MGSIRFGPYRVHPTQGLYRGSAEVRLTPKALAVLYLLATRLSEVVTKSELFAAVWPSSVVTDAALSSCIRELRRALDDDARNPRHIETVHRRGFRLRVVSDALEQSGPESAVEARSVAAPQSHVLGPVERASSASDASPSAPSIVILPFENVQSDPSVEVLARGLVHDVITQVARSRTMLVVARGTAFQFRGQSRDVRRIGRKLGLRYVVQGAVQLSRGRLCVSVALADAETRAELWSERYERKPDDVLSLQCEIAELIVASLEYEVQRQETRQALLMPSSNLDAWAAYHRGLHHMYTFRQEDCELAEHWFRRSIELEPGLPRPYAGLSFIQFARAFLSFDRHRASTVQKAFDYALRSVSIDPRDPMSHWALSRAHLLSGELEQAKESVEVAVELNPSYAVAQYSLGWVALLLGDNQLCLDKVGFAQRLSPYDPLKFAMLGVRALNLALVGRTAEAAELALRATRQVNVHHHALAFAAVTHALDGQIEPAGRFLARIRKVSPGYDLKHFFAAFPFRRARDVDQVKQAFEVMRKQQA